MEEKKSESHSWGELYETMQTLEGEWTDRILEKGFEIMKKLDSAKTINEVETIVRENPLTTYELNRINSLCLDGIYFSSITSISDLIKTKPQYVEACKYYVANFGTRLDFSQEQISYLLEIACKWGRKEMAQILLNNISTETLKQKYDRSYFTVLEKSLKNAIEYGHAEVVELLPPTTSFRNSYIRTVSIEMAKVLLAKNYSEPQYLMDVAIGRPNNYTKNQDWKYTKNIELAKFLLENYFDAFLVQHYLGYHINSCSLVYYFHEACLRDFRELVEILLRSQYKTYITFSAETFVCSSEQIAKILLPYTNQYEQILMISANRSDKKRWLLLDSIILSQEVLDRCLVNACENCCLPLIQFLVEKGANVHYDNNAAIFASCRHRHEQSIKFLLSKGADIYAENEKCLIFAASFDDMIGPLSLILDAYSPENRKKGYEKALTLAYENNRPMNAAFLNMRYTEKN